MSLYDGSIMTYGIYGAPVHLWSGSVREWVIWMYECMYVDADVGAVPG